MLVVVFNDIKKSFPVHRLVGEEVGLLLLAVAECDVQVGVGVAKPAGQLCSTVDGAVLSSGSAEGDAEVGETAFGVFLDALADDGLDMCQEGVDGGFFAQELDDGTVVAGVAFEFGITPGIGQLTAVEDVPAAVAGGVLRQPFLVAETLHRDGRRVAAARR